MDVQMPIMGELEATAAVRTQEQTTGGHLPIIAMTARATDGDRDTCLAAGMDDYVTKPLKVDDLYMAIARIQTVQPKPSRAVVEPPLALSIALAHVDGDKALLVEVVESFLRNYPQQIVELREALRIRDAQRIQRVADNLKDMVALLGAKQAYTLARTLETLGKEVRLEDAPNLLDRLELILDHMTTAFAKPDWLEALS
jgi:two-component system sensor histidine kinase/response regulator